MALALYTFGIFDKPAADPANDGFHAVNDAIFDAVDRAPGLIARSGYEGDPGPRSWGPHVWPRFYVERGDGWSPATLSLWRDIASARAFAETGLHARAMAQGERWMRRGAWPGAALWWVRDGARPTWAEAARRLEHLADHGPSAEAFDFATAFPEPA